jgi:SAM-dependent methyltransferase
MPDAAAKGAPCAAALYLARIQFLFVVLARVAPARTAPLWKPAVFLRESRLSTTCILARSFLYAGLVALCVTAPLHAQPRRIQPPKSLDVPYVPTNQPTVEAMLRVANVGPDDFVIDLGSGDGRILITAARLRGARGFGVDIDPQRVKEGTENAKAAGVADRVQFFQRNLFDTRIAEATVVTMYLLPRVNIELRPRLLAELRPGTRVVSHDFDMGDWNADLRTTVRGAGSDVYLWIIPAQVAGRWQVELADPRGRQSFELEIRQKYQAITTLTRALDRPASIRDARLDGSRISFALIDDGQYANRLRFEGEVKGNAIEGMVRGDGPALREEQKWRATRATP